MKIYEGKTVNLAVENALKDLNVTENDIIFKIIDEGTKGILGIGGKKAKISVELKSDDAKRSVEFLDGLFDLLKVPAQAEYTEVDDKIIINVITTASSQLIGYRGDTLNAIQTILGGLKRAGEGRYRVYLDVGNYKKDREQSIVDLANKMADKAEEIERNVHLDPLNPYERRIVHSALQGRELVETESMGEGEKRHVVIKFKR